MIVYLDYIQLSLYMSSIYAASIDVVCGVKVPFLHICVLFVTEHCVLKGQYTVFTGALVVVDDR